MIVRLRRDRLRVVHGVGGQRQQVDAMPIQRPLRVQPGQQQQILDQQTHPARLALDARHQHLDVAGGALPVQLGEAADRGQRRAQLVAGVGDEAAHPFLGAAGLLGRRLRRRHRALDLREHAVERQRQPAHFGARITLRDTTIELSGGDGGGGLLDLGQRPQAAMHHPVAGDAEHQQHRRADARPAPDQRAHGRLDVGQVDGDGGQLAVRPAHRHRAPLHMRVVDRADRDRHGPDVVVGGQRPVRRRDR